MREDNTIITKKFIGRVIPTPALVGRKIGQREQYAPQKHPRNAAKK